MLESLLTHYISPRFQEDERYRRGNIRIINPLPRIRILGLHIPEMKKIANSIVEDGGTSLLIQEFEKIQQEEPRSGILYEEKMLWGMLLNRTPCSLDDRLGSFHNFIPAIDNWAVCNSICSDAKWCRKDMVKTWKFLQTYFNSKKEFEVRFIHYVNMAVAWLLATALYKFSEETRQFVNSGAIPENIKKLYIRKAKESFRTKQTEPL